MIDIRKSVEKDAIVLAKKLRTVDLLEIRAFTGRDPKTSLLSGLKSSKKCWSGFIDNQIIGMFGVGDSPDDAKIGVPWMLASDGIYERKRLFIKESKLWLQILIKDYDALVNYVAANNTYAIRWLKWLGFDLVSLYEGLGTKGEDFWKFVMIKEDVNE